MSWTAQKVFKDITASGQILVDIVYTDGIDKILDEQRSFPVPADWPDGIMRARLAVLNAPQDIKAQFSAIQLGDPLPAPNLIPPTPEQVAEQAWFMAYRAWIQVKKAVDQKLGKKTQADVDAARANLDALPYLDVYEASL